jgi:EAL domain-containing protein (putative c-di-GMP-specific phosphodiesterase class I)
VAVGTADLGTTISTLLRDADTALYEAKDTSPGSLVVFDPSLRERVERRRRLQADLRATLQEEGGLHLAYQPMVQQDGEIVLVEALLRWQHPDEGPLSPGEFLPVAAAAGLLPALDRWVVARVCEQRRAWADEGVLVAISVNVTPETVSHGNLVDWVEDSCLLTGTPPTALVLELTETAVLDHPAAASRTLEALRQRGVRIALDDFGTGYSSLSLLRDLPVDIVKIDRSFVHGLVPDSADGLIVRAATDLAHALGMRTVAEGIETAAEWEAATALGCDLLQGWYIARALDAVTVAQHVGGLPAPRRAYEEAVGLRRP